MKFKYGDNVKVINGFHKGRSGKLVNEASNEYQVNFGEEGSGIIHKRDLEKIGERS